MNNLKKYLPSKKFTSIVLVIVIFITLFFAVKGIISLFSNKKAASKEPIKVTIGSIIQKDGNNNGIPDYEERLWGLDPDKNGPENKEFILAKKKTLADNGVITTDDSGSITENDALSREFFATVISLQQTGELNDESMKSVSEALGKNVVSTPIPDIYTSSMVKTVNDSMVANTTYREAIGKLVTKYQNDDIGSELTLIIQGISNKDPQALFAAKTIAEAYKSFGADLIKIPVPRSLAATHLSMANNYEKTGKSIETLTQMLSDPIVGMKTIINYKKYSDALASDLEKISNALQ
jgi:flagellar biosynthesis regulator FlbT